VGNSVFIYCESTGREAGIVTNPCRIRRTLSVCHTVVCWTRVEAKVQYTIYRIYLHNRFGDVTGSLGNTCILELPDVKHNIIRNGGIFYIIGKLDPNAGPLAPADPANPTAAELADGIDWPTGDIACLPPCKDDYTTLKERRVFIQDFMTVANFVIGENSLKHAYLTTPDLRYSALTLGLSVDIKWSTGLNFGDVILGGN